MKFFTCEKCICMEHDRDYCTRYCRALHFDMTNIFWDFSLDSENYVHPDCPLKPDMTALEIYQLIYS